MKEILKQIPLTIKNTYYKTKIPETHDIYRWWMVYGKSAKGLPPLGKTKLSTNHKRGKMKFKKYIWS